MPIRIAGEPRSIEEIEFVAGMHPCEACGDRREVAWRIGGHGATWIASARCARCGSERGVELECARDLLQAERPAPGELGGRAPSAVLEPIELVRELDRLLPTLLEDPTGLHEPDWSLNRRAVDRACTVLRELAKFLPEGEPAIAEHRSEAGREDQRARPERYARAWIAAELARWSELAERIARDAPRVFAADPILRRDTPPRGRIDHTALESHAFWLGRGGGGGMGRLDVVTVFARGAELDSADLRQCRLEGVLLARARLRTARLDGAELVDVELHDAELGLSTWTGAALVRVALDRAELAGARFDGARLDDVTLAGARARGSRWDGAALTRVRGSGAALGLASLAGARLVDCELVRASLQGASLAGATLERCDLRGVSLADCDLSGASLVACKLGGASGTPRAIEGWHVIDADFSDAGDASDVGDADDLAAELGYDGP